MEKLSIKKISSVLAIAVGTIGISSCGPDSPNLKPGVPGVVVGHTYDDEDHWLQPMPIGKTMTLIPQTDREHFYLSVQQCGHVELMDDTNSDGCDVFSREVDEQTYSVFQDGEQIVFEK